MRNVQGEKAMKLTSHERIMRIFQNKEIDRPALKLWGAGHEEDRRFLHPAYAPVQKLAARTSDVFAGLGFPCNLCAGQYIEQYTERWQEDTPDPLWKNAHTVFHTPKGDLHSINRISTVGEPSYIVEHMIKEPEDIEKLLSMEYKPYPVDPKVYHDLVGKVGDRGVVMPTVIEAGLIIHELLGSETLGYFSVDCREELQQLVDVYAARSLEHTKNMLDAGIVAPFAWVGPELYLPPLMGPAEFHDFVYKADKPICDLIHDRGGYVWVHCHGKVANFIDSFIDMGVDVLNPLEPPKNGDIHMGEIIKKYGNRIGWEGNIEIQDLLLSSPDQVRALIDECVRYGKDSGRFILCPSAGFEEYPFPTQHYIDNLLLYLQYGLEAVEGCRK